MDYSYLEKNLELVKIKMKNAALAANRDGGEILLMPAVKYADAEQINYLHTHLGINDVGENRVQQLLERWDKLDKEGLRVHFIGSHCCSFFCLIDFYSMDLYSFYYSTV